MGIGLLLLIVASFCVGLSRGDDHQHLYLINPQTCCSLTDDYEVMLDWHSSQYSNRYYGDEATSRRRDVLPITVATHLTIDRWAQLVRWCQEWRGPISASILLPRTLSGAKRVIADLKRRLLHRLGKGDPGCITGWVDIHLVSPVPFEDLLQEESEEDADLEPTGWSEEPTGWSVLDKHYPFNVQRNAAINGVKNGHHCLAVDVDIHWRPGKKKHDGVKNGPSYHVGAANGFAQALDHLASYPGASPAQRHLERTNRSENIISGTTNDLKRIYWSVQAIQSLSEVHSIGRYSPLDGEELHKLMLEQFQEFASSFDGYWKEYQQTFAREQRALGDQKKGKSRFEVPRGNEWVRSHAVLVSFPPDWLNTPFTKLQPFYYDNDPVIYGLDNLTDFLLLPSNNRNRSRGSSSKEDPLLYLPSRFEVAYEPYALFSSESLTSLPALDERFIGRHRDKVSWFVEMNYRGWRGMLLNPFHFGFLFNQGAGDGPQEYAHAPVDERGEVVLRPESYEQDHHGNIMYLNFEDMLRVKTASRKRDEGQYNIFHNIASDIKDFLAEWSSFESVTSMQHGSEATDTGATSMFSVVPQYACILPLLSEWRTPEATMEEYISLIENHLGQEVKGGTADEAEQGEVEAVPPSILWARKARRILDALANVDGKPDGKESTPSTLPRAVYQKYKLDRLIARSKSQLKASSQHIVNRKDLLEHCRSQVPTSSPPDLTVQLMPCQSHIKICTPDYATLISKPMLQTFLKSMCGRLGNRICNKVVIPFTNELLSRPNRQGSLRQDFAHSGSGGSSKKDSSFDLLPLRMALVIATSMHFQLYRCTLADTAQDGCKWTGFSRSGYLTGEDLERIFKQQ